MPDRTFDFDAEYNDALIDGAAKTFVHRLLKKYLWLLVAACVMTSLDLWLYSYFLAAAP